MMRFSIVSISFVLAATGTMAHPLAIPKPLAPGPVFLDLGSIRLHLFRREDGNSASSAPSLATSKDWSAQSTLPKLSMGPLRAEFGSDDNPRANLSSYKLQGVDQLGSSVWEAEKGRAAKILFVWPTDK